MKRYGNGQRHAGGASGVVAFQLNSDSIDVEFRDGKRYRYTYAVPGEHEVEQMKLLAEAGKGLATFINKYVRDRFAARLR